MAHNCLIEEARESIFTGLEGVADAKSAGAFVLIRDGLKERSEKNASHTLVQNLTKHDCFVSARP